MGERDVVAIDIGGTTTRVALFADPARSTVCTALATFPTDERYERQLDKLATIIRKHTTASSKITNPVSLNDPVAGDLPNAVSLKTNPISNQTNAVSIGVSIGARLARDGGAAAVAPNLRDYEGRPFARDLAQRADAPVQSVRLAQ